MLQNDFPSCCIFQKNVNKNMEILNNRREKSYGAKLGKKKNNIRDLL